FVRVFIYPGTDTNLYTFFVLFCFYQILYANEGECRKDLEVESVQPAEKTNFLNHKGHEFVPTLYHFPANCEACAKPLWHVFKPPPAVECRRCHVKCHKDHLDKKEELIAPCKVDASFMDLTWCSLRMVDFFHHIEVFTPVVLSDTTFTSFRA
ncbi:hypothetical protein E2320_011320, partial [Naja naja]